MNWELSDVQAGFRKDKNQRSDCQHPLDHRKSKRVPEKDLLLLFWLYQKPLTVWITTNCRRFFKRWEYQTTSPAFWEICTQVKNQQLEPGMDQWTDWFQIGKGVREGCILSLCLFNVYAEYIMQNAVLDEAQAGIEIAGRNSNNFRLLIKSEVKLVKSDNHCKWWLQP